MFFRWVNLHPYTEVENVVGNPDAARGGAYKTRANYEVTCAVCSAPLPETHDAPGAVATVWGLTDCPNQPTVGAVAD